LSVRALLSFSNHGRYTNPSIKAELILRADIRNDNVDRANCSHNMEELVGARSDVYFNSENIRVSIGSQKKMGQFKWEFQQFYRFLSCLVNSK